MNSGSIDNPRTKEGQLYALFSANIGREFTTMQIGQHINSFAAHTYIDGCRDQVEARGEYRIVREQRGRLHYYRMVKCGDCTDPQPLKKIRPRPAKRVVRRVHTESFVHAAGQMELAGVGG